MSTDPASTEPNVDPDALVAELMGSPVDTEPAAPAPLELAPLATDPPIADPVEPPAPTDGTSNVALPGDEVFAQLERARHDHQTTATNLHGERQKNTGLEAQVAHLTAQLEGLQTGINMAPAAAPVAQPGPIPQVDDASLDAFMVNVDPDWQTNREDPHMKAAARYSLMISSEGIKYSQAAINRVAGAQQTMAFDTKLSSLNINRAQFDAVWNQPGYEWGATLDDHQKLAALESQVARMPGSRPANQPGPPAGAQGGAPTTSRVDARRTIETDQSAGGVHNPSRLTHLKVDQAIESGNPQQLQAAGDVLFDQLFSAQMGQ